MRRTVTYCDAPGCVVRHTFEQAPGPRKADNLPGWHIVTFGPDRIQTVPEEPHWACSRECAQRIATIAAGNEAANLPLKITVESLGQ